MEGIQQWTAQHAIVNPKLKDLRERYVVAKKELTRLKAIPHPSPVEKSGNLMVGLRAWFNGIKARSVITARFGAVAVDPAFTLEHLLFAATGGVNMAETEAKQLKHVGHAAFHLVDDMETHQARMEKVTAAQVKELLEEANNMTKLLKSQDFKKQA